MASLTKNTVYDKAHKAALIVANRFGVNDVELAKYLTAIAYVESTFQTDVKNKNSSARGLTQVLINTQRWIEKKLKLPFAKAMMKASKYPEAPVTALPEEDRMFESDYALLIGAWYLAYNYSRYNNWYKAVTAYHLGSYNSSNADGKIYKDKVLKAYNDLQLGTPQKRTKTKRVPIRLLVSKDIAYLYKSNY